jgi:transcriptional regulator with XRE-family HTH domain
MYGRDCIRAIKKGHGSVTVADCAYAVLKDNRVSPPAGHLRGRKCVLAAQNLAWAQYAGCVANEWWNYVTRIAGTDEQKKIADVSGIGTTVISRWSKGHNEPSAQSVVVFSRAYGRPPVEALVAAGYLTGTEAAEAIEIHRGPDALTDDELLAEVQRRMKGVRSRSELGKERMVQNALEHGSVAEKAVAGLLKDADLGNAKPAASIDFAIPQTNVVFELDAAVLPKLEAATIDHAVIEAQHATTMALIDAVTTLSSLTPDDDVDTTVAVFYLAVERYEAATVDTLDAMQMVDLHATPQQIDAAIKAFDFFATTSETFIPLLEDIAAKAPTVVLRKPAVLHGDLLRDLVRRLRLDKAAWIESGLSATHEPSVQRHLIAARTAPEGSTPGQLERGDATSRSGDVQPIIALFPDGLVPPWIPQKLRELFQMMDELDPSLGVSEELEETLRSLTPAADTPAGQLAQLSSLTAALGRARERLQNVQVSADTEEVLVSADAARLIAELDSHLQSLTLATTGTRYSGALAAAARITPRDYTPGRSEQGEAGGEESQDPGSDE